MSNKILKVITKGTPKNINFLSEIIEYFREKFKIEEEFSYVEISDDIEKIAYFLENHKHDENMDLGVTEKGRTIEHPIFYYNSPDYKIITDVEYGNDYTALHLFAFIKNREKFSKDFHDGKKRNLYKPGIYKIKQGMGTLYLKPMKIERVDIPNLNENLEKKVFGNMTQFFQNKKFFEENNLPFKRGVLFYGPPGNGKTMFIKYILNKILTMGYAGIIINCTEDTIYSEATDFLNGVFKDTPRVIVLEDIDGIENFQRSTMLNFLDGVKPLQNTFIIATTNYPENVDAGLVKRPSRFDMIYKFGNPNKEARRALLKKYFPSANEEELGIYVDETRGFSGAYFKELFIIKNLQQITILNAIKGIKKQIKFLVDHNEECKNYFG